jgi:hypothetical protein
VIAALPAAVSFQLFGPAQQQSAPWSGRQVRAHRGHYGCQVALCSSSCCDVWNAAATCHAQSHSCFYSCSYSYSCCGFCCGDSSCCEAVCDAAAAAQGCGSCCDSCCCLCHLPRQQKTAGPADREIQTSPCHTCLVGTATCCHTDLRWEGNGGHEGAASQEAVAHRAAQET